MSQASPVLPSTCGSVNSGEERPVGPQPEHGKATQDDLDGLHGLLARYFASELGKGDAPPSLVNAARQFLRDNHIEASVANGTIKQIADGIPTFDEDERSA